MTEQKELNSICPAKGESFFYDKDSIIKRILVRVLSETWQSDGNGKIPLKVKSKI